VHRVHRRAVAYRVLGSSGGADDAVQEAWVRYGPTDTAEVAWLTTVVSRALNIRRSRRCRRYRRSRCSTTTSRARCAGRGAEAVGRRAMALADLGLLTQPALVNGVAGAVTIREGVASSVGAFTVRGGRSSLDILADPDRPRARDLTVLGV
jgi:hypothetical protein